MSARRSLYGQSLIRNASTLSFNTSNAEPVETYYKLALINPVKPIDEDSLDDKANGGLFSNGSGLKLAASNNNSSMSLSSLASGSNTPDLRSGYDDGNGGVNGHGIGNNANGNNGNANLPKYNFKIISWVSDSTPYSSPDCDEDDILNISELINKQVADAQNTQRLKQRKVTGNDGLSAADIRGAVGVEEGISGFGSSAAHAAKEEQKKKEEKESKQKENGTEQGTEQQQQNRSKYNEGDGDIKMTELGLAEEDAPTATATATAAQEVPKDPESAPVAPLPQTAATTTVTAPVSQPETTQDKDELLPTEKQETFEETKTGDKEGELLPQIETVSAKANTDKPESSIAEESSTEQQVKIDENPQQEQTKATKNETDADVKQAAPAAAADKPETKEENNPGRPEETKEHQAKPADENSEKPKDADAAVATTSAGKDTDGDVEMK